MATVKSGMTAATTSVNVLMLLVDSTGVQTGELPFKVLETLLTQIDL